MLLSDKNTGKSLKSVIEKIEEIDYDEIRKSKEYIFNWQEESENEVYKIFLEEDESEILGLISLIDYPSEYRIHLNLIEVGLKNRGRNKRIENIAGCLIAFACQLAFERDYFGFVSLKPKTKLVDLYQNVYGFRRYGILLAVEQESSRKLIKKYWLNVEK